MRKAFRPSMAWLHTWAGLIVGWLLFFVFVTGTAGYFWVELDRWMRPELPLAAPAISVERFVAEAERYLHRHAPAADEWLIRLPGRRGDYAMDGAIAWVSAAETDRARAPSRWLIFDPVSHTFAAGPRVTPRATGGGYVLYRMHKHLHYLPREPGIWLVCACSMVMLVALVTGLVAHKHLFRELFTFRPGRGRRSWLDLHTVLGVFGLPFMMMITFSGTVLFGSTYLPGAVGALYGDAAAAFEEDLFLPIRRADQIPRAHRTATMLPLDRALSAATRYWGDRAVREISVFAPGDRQATVRLSHALNRTIVRDVELEEALYFDAVDGRLLQQRTARQPWPRQLAGALFGLHEAMFAGAVLRWIYFGSGLAGCITIATGLVLWTAKRRESSWRGGARGVGYELVERLNIGTIAGLPAAVAIYFWANRLLPSTMASRAEWEVHCLFMGWAAMFLHAAVRPSRSAWSEALWICAGLYALLPGLNAITTERHLAITVPAGDWALAGVDLTFIGLAVVMGLAAMKARRAGDRASAQARHATRSPGLSMEGR